MNDVTYRLPTFGTLLNHFPQRQPVARDTAFAGFDKSESDEAEELLIRARIRSGDYFVTLATELDKMAQGLCVAQAPEAPELERVVSELFYIHDNFRLIPS